MLPEGCGPVVIRGTVPDHPRLSRQHLVVKAAGRELGNWPVGPGNFEVCFRSPSARPIPFSFEVVASRYKRPALGSERSWRRMAFLLESVDWVR
jgi:hypothetical protein